MENQSDVIIGIHSIRAALLNPQREWFRLWATRESIKEVVKKEDEKREMEVRYFNSDAELQTAAQKLYQQRSSTYHRIPSSLLLETSPLKLYTAHDLWQDLHQAPLKILILDRVNDVHNGAAIIRTAAFYGVNYFILSLKGHFGLSPSFYRMASGGVEVVKIMTTAHLPKLITTLQEKQVECVGLCERGEEHYEPFSNTNEYKGRCLILGSEEEGLSHAVERVIQKKLALIPKGSLGTLNVSVAAGIAMERFF